MKKLKLLLCLFCIILLSGCSGDYNITVNKDLSIKEELNLEIENKEDTYKKTMEIFNTSKIPLEKYHVSIKGEKVEIEYKEEFSSIDDYILNSKIYHQLVDEIKYSKLDNYVDIYIDQDLKLNQNNLNIGNTLDIDHLQINIKNPYKVITNNSDSSSKNIYTWNITNDMTNKKILMQFEPKSKQSFYSILVTATVLAICISILIYIIVKNYRNANKI